MCKALALAAALASFMGMSMPAAAASAFNHDDLGFEFCRLTLSGDLAGLRPLLSRELTRALDQASANPALPPPDVLFQTYTTPVAVCGAKTVNAALVQITRSQPDGTGWIDYLVVVPEADGQSRIDDVLFAIRKSDTLMSRLLALGGGR